MDMIRTLAQELGIKTGQAEAAVKLIDEGNTIPFIARYRKEVTGALNDEVLRNLYERLNYLRNLEEKKRWWQWMICTVRIVRNEEPVPLLQKNVVWNRWQIS